MQLYPRIGNITKEINKIVIRNVIFLLVNGRVQSYETLAFRML